MGKLTFTLGIILGLILFIPLVIITMIGLIPIGIFLLILLALGAVIAVFVFWIWMLIDCIRNDRITNDERLIWVIVIIFINIIGAVMYYFLGYRQEKKTEHTKHKAAPKVVHRKHRL
jgi:NADH:ubiquinone oxidoreductase subunit 6 (subunit J)